MPATGSRSPCLASATGGLDQQAAACSKQGWRSLPGNGTIPVMVEPSALVQELGRARRAVRARLGLRQAAVSALGPLVVLAGVIWAVVQPERLTLLHPRGQGFWWLVLEPQLLVIAAG